MAQEFYRIRIDLAIPKSTWDILQKTSKDSIIDKIIELKNYATKLNAGTSEEEDTVQVKYHLCNHELNKPCPEDEDIETLKNIGSK